MPRIQAEEALHELQVVQVGTGSIKRSRASRLIDRWKRIARRGAKPKLTPEQWRARIAASRISFVKVEKRQ